MFEELGAILETSKKMLVQMERSNDNMERLTKQLEILTKPPDMIKWAISRKSKE
jgi:hypothetical protein